MSNEQKPKIENLEQQEEELTPKQAEEVQGGIINSLEFKRPPTTDAGYLQIEME